MSSSTETARAVLTALIRAGVREVVIAPGSRNAPLSFAAYDAAQAGLLRLHTRIDERSAGFLALGLSKNGARAAVICTSGTAAANLHPAALEAAHAGVPLVLVTADRPARLRETGANQTTLQTGLFGPLVPSMDLTEVPDGLERIVGPETGPCHLNVQLDDPLTPADRWSLNDGSVAVDSGIGTGRVGGSSRFEPAIGETIERAQAPSEERARVLAVSEEAGREASATISPGSRTVVVAGDDAGPPARQLAEAGGWPLLAEPSSGSRTGANAIRTYRLLLGTELADRIERVVVFGHPTLSRPVAQLLARTDVEIIAAPARGVWPAPPHRVDRRLLTTRPQVGAFGDEAITRPGQRPDSTVTEPSFDWLEEWRDADASLCRQLDQLLAEEPELTPHEVAGAVARALPPGGQLIVGPSNPIRDLDLMVPRYEVGARRKVLASRGLAGIDGIVSTAIGAALGRHEGSTRDLALMGDVTFLHDANGLVLGPDEPRPDLTIVVVNDDGGSIFATLEQGAEQYADAFERLFATPHHVDLAALCAATRTPHLRVTSRPELEQALANPNGGIEVIEAVVGRADRRALDQRIRALRP